MACIKNIIRTPLDIKNDGNRDDPVKFSGKFSGKAAIPN